MTKPLTGPIVLDETEGNWTYHYGEPPDGYQFYGRTQCCARAVYTLHRPTVASEPLINDCCGRPYPMYGPKPVELPPYSGEHATCPKCGVKAVETRLRGPGVAAYGMSSGSALTEWMVRPGYPKEWLARRCANCQATWDEATVSVIPTDGDADASG